VEGRWKIIWLPLARHLLNNMSVRGSTSGKKKFFCGEEKKGGANPPGGHIMTGKGGNVIGTGRGPLAATRGPIYKIPFRIPWDTQVLQGESLDPKKERKTYLLAGLKGRKVDPALGK